MDYVLGADGQWRTGHTYVRGSLQHKLRRPGRFGYRFADETTWEAAVGRFVSLADTRTLAVEGLFSAEHKGFDTLGGAAELDTGFSGHYAGARGVRTTIGQSLAAGFVGELPLLLRTTETMVVPDYRPATASEPRRRGDFESRPLSGDQDESGSAEPAHPAKLKPFYSLKTEPHLSGAAHRSVRPATFYEPGIERVLAS
jgi:hypothetical protein